MGCFKPAVSKIAARLMTGLLRSLNNKNEQFEPARHAQFLKDAEKVILDRMFAEPQLICNLPIALPLRSVLGHLEFPLRRRADSSSMPSQDGALRSASSRY